MPNARINRDERHPKERAEKAIDALFSDVTSAPELEEIRQWLLEEDDAELKNTLLQKRFRDIYFQYDKGPDQALANWPELARKLGLDENLCQKQYQAMIQRRKRPVPLYKRVGFKVAAVLIPLLAVAGALVISLPEKESQTENRITFSVPAEGQTFTLPDGSRIDAKPGAIVAYAENFTENRSVTLTGEAFFSVTKDASHPFTVEGGMMKVTVHGTEFNVRAYENDMENEVVLASGSVSVTVEDQTIAMEPMQRLRVNRTDQKIELEEINESELLKLRGLVLDFNGTPLRQAFQLLGNYYGMQVEITGNANLSDEVVMTFDENTTLEDALSILQIALPKFTYTIEGDTITISSK